MRDFYDVYLIYTKDWNNINYDYFNNAIIKTFKKREYYGDPFAALKVIKESALLKARWNIYQKRYEYAKNINFDDILNCIDQILKEIELINL